MRTPIDKGNLELTKPGYPWQVIEGDGVTWLILRQKNKLENKEIKTLEGVYLDHFSWTLQEKSRGKYIYSGNLTLSVRYRAGLIDGNSVEFVDEGEDEVLCREVLLAPDKSQYKNQKYMTLEPSKESNPIDSIFPSLLLDKVDRIKNTNEVFADDYWNLNIPWQANLHCSGQGKEPRIAKVHLAQIGLSTILIEVLLEFVADERIPGIEIQSGDYSLVFQGEKILTIDDDDIQEVLGVVQQRGLYKALADCEEKSFLLMNSLCTSIIYISAICGGERILTASCINKEETKLTGISSLLLPPVDYYQTGQEIKYNLADKRKLVCRYKQKCEIMQKYIASRDDQITDSLKEECNQKNKKQEDLTKIIRKKACEKWIKKTGPNKDEKSSYKLFMTIKK